MNWASAVEFLHIVCVVFCTKKGDMRITSFIISYLLQVYNVTEFLEEHPGGDEVLLLAAETLNKMLELRTSSECLAEKDATDDFEDVGHSDSAKELMEKYYVGDIDISTLPEVDHKPFQLQAPQPNPSSGGAVKILQFLLPLLILAIAFALHFYGKLISHIGQCLPSMQLWC
ncbi:hypothetical protein TIFTF001_012062 [Ficus carica]|uniref:Cytochrome b5 heme-binding domain-containing protein n=1 Tax=Ficus carica TaxID=3494 RepID=A0AA88D1C2_FICCA|nr:hypothetical protein TIFTF001_012062 [Ficus carica]